MAISFDPAKRDATLLHRGLDFAPSCHSRAGGNPAYTETTMTESKPVSDPAWVDPDDAPEWTDEMFARATFRIGDTIIRRGRPKGSTKQQVSLRLDTAVIDRFRADGPGWQSRMNEALRKAAGL